MSKRETETAAGAVSDFARIFRGIVKTVRGAAGGETDSIFDRRRRQAEAIEAEGQEVKK